MFPANLGLNTCLIFNGNLGKKGKILLPKLQRMLLQEQCLRRYFHQL